MRAVGYRKSLPITDPESLIDLDLPQPEPGPRDLLVKVEAVSVNPVDTKVRRGPSRRPAASRCWAGTRPAPSWPSGAEVAGFSPGDAVFYAGDLTRPGTNANSIASMRGSSGTSPQTLDWAQAAALPLTAITAWETLFDRLDTGKPVPGAAPAILIVGGAGGVGSVAIQLARQLTDLTVIATASRPETAQWCRDLGAHHVVDHSRPLAAEVAALGLGAPGLVFSTTNTDAHLAEIVGADRPAGPARPDRRSGAPRRRAPQAQEPVAALGVHVHPVDVRHRRHRRPGRAARRGRPLVDAGRLRTTLGEHYGRIDAANLRRAHALIESGRAKGKIVLEGFSA